MRYIRTQIHTHKPENSCSINERNIAVRCSLPQPESARERESEKIKQRQVKNLFNSKQKRRQLAVAN